MHHQGMGSVGTWKSSLTVVAAAGALILAARMLVVRWQMLKRPASALAEEATEEPRLRTFVGVRLSQALQTRLGCQLQDWKGAGLISGRLTRQDKIHITCKFIGETPVSAVQPLLQELQAAMSSHRPVAISIEGLGSFRSYRSHIVWAGVHDPSGELQALAATAHQVAERCGLGKAEGRPFRPHVTLARAARSRWCDSVQGELRFGEMIVDAVELFESRGPDYISLGSAPLLGAAVDDGEPV